MARKLIHTETLNHRKVKIYHDTEWREYVNELYDLTPITVKGGFTTLTWVLIKGANYHTDDKHDALTTALAMVKPVHKIKPKVIFSY